MVILKKGGLLDTTLRGALMSFSRVVEEKDGRAATPRRWVAGGQCGWGGTTKGQGPATAPECGEVIP